MGITSRRRSRNMRRRWWAICLASVRWTRSERMKYELGIIGAGNMAEAITRGIVGARTIAPAGMIAADVSEKRREVFRTQLGIEAIEDNVAVARESRVLLLSVKPQ